MPELSNPEIRKLKAAAQLLEPVMRVGKPRPELGKGGLTEAVLQSVEQALRARELIKIRPRPGGT